MFASYPTALCLLLMMTLTCSLGCSKNHKMPAATSPEAARQTLTMALDAWKAGSDTKSLAQASKPVFVGDEDWLRGDRLTAYSLLDQGSAYGTNVRIVVDLQLTSASGGSWQERARYIVATNPVLSVKRDDSDRDDEMATGAGPGTVSYQSNRGSEIPD